MNRDTQTVRGEKYELSKLAVFQVKGNTIYNLQFCLQLLPHDMGSLQLIIASIDSYPPKKFAAGA